MNILFLTGHPAQIHNFRVLKKHLETKGHSVFWLATEKDISRYLLKHYQIKYTIMSKPGISALSKLYILIKNTHLCIKYIKNNNIDMILSRVSPYAALAGWLLRRPHIALADTETAGLYETIFTRFISTFLTAKTYKRNLRKDQIRFNGNIELFYLHPNHFQPDKSTLDLLGVKKDETFVVMRFVSWDAYHDKGLSGFTNENKMKAVKELSKFAKVFISAEKGLPPELEQYRIKVPLEKIHDVLAQATLFFGEGATMASECAVLGAPAIYINQSLGYIEEAAKYGLVHIFNQSPEDQEQAIDKAVELLQDPLLKQKTLENRAKFLIDKIDITAFMVWFIENYPESFKIMKENPDYQEKFK